MNDYPQWVRDAAHRIGGNLGLTMEIIWTAYNGGPMCPGCGTKIPPPPGGWPQDDHTRTSDPSAKI
jgi:hypothetical protein